MSVVSPQRPNRSQDPWDKRNVAELSQTNFRTALRGFDRGEVRAILESVAADYRVLQLQNASLRRQLADLEAVLDAYQRGDHPAINEPAAGHMLERTHHEARPILMEAKMKAEDTNEQSCDAPAVPASDTGVTIATKTVTPSFTFAPVRPPAHDAEWREWARTGSLQESADPIETVELLLKNIDQMLGEIPALPGR